MPYEFTEEDEEPICADCRFCVVPDAGMLPEGVHIAWCIDSGEFVDPYQEVPCEW